jgi:hypothetical protein
MGYIVPLAILLPIGAALLDGKKVTRSAYAVLLLYLLLTALVSIVSKVLLLYKITNIPLIHTDTLMEVVLLLIYLRKVLKHPVVLKAVDLLTILFPLYCLVNFIFLQSIYTFNTYTRPVGAILLILLCMGYWWESGNEEEPLTWRANPHNWFVSGILLYFSSSLFLFVFSNYLTAHSSLESNILVWNIHATLVLIMYLIFTLGFLNVKHNR